MPLRKLTDCTKEELGSKAASMVFLAEHGLRVPEARIWLAPRRIEDINEFIRPGADTIILRTSEPLGSDPQGVSGSFPSELLTVHEPLGSALNYWLRVEHPVIVQHFVPAIFGGASHVTSNEEDKLIAHLSWSLDVKGIMDGSDSGMDVWLGDLPMFEEEGVPILIARAEHIPEAVVDTRFVSEFVSQMRSVAHVLREPFEVEWIVDNTGSLVFLQLIQIREIEESPKMPWIHADASVYAKQSEEFL